MFLSVRKDTYMTQKPKDLFPISFKWKWNLKANTLFFGPKAKDFLEVQDDELQLSDWVKFFHIKCRPNITKVFTRYIKNPNPTAIKVLACDHKQKHCYSALLFMDLGNEDGSFIEGKLVILQEVEKEKIETFHFPVGDVIKVNSEKNITYIPSNFLTAMKFKRDDLLGNSIRVLNSGHHGTKFYQRFYESLEERRVWHGEFLNKDKEGQFVWFQTIVFKLDNGNFIGVYFNHEEAQLELQSQIKTGQLEIIGESTAQILHDVMNPLQILTGGIRTIRKIMDGHGITDESLDQILNLMDDSGTRMRQIFKDTKALLRQETRLQGVNVSECLDKAINFTRAKWKGLKVEIIIIPPQDETPLLILGNEGQLIQVMINLINNSCDALAERPKEEKKWIKVSFERLGRKMIYSHTDSGNGIPDEFQEKIFESLFTTKSIEKGTGLGLPLCRKIIKSFNGKLELNKNDPNTRFDILIPLYKVD